MPNNWLAAWLSRAATTKESLGRPSRSAASAATSWIVSPSGTVKRSAAFLPCDSMVSTVQGEVPAGNSYTPAWTERSTLLSLAISLNQPGWAITPWAARLSVTAPNEAPGGRMTRAGLAEELHERTEKTERADKMERAPRFDFPRNEPGVFTRRPPKFHRFSSPSLPPCPSSPSSPPYSDVHPGNAAASRRLPGHRPLPCGPWWTRLAPIPQPMLERCSSAHPIAPGADRCGGPRPQPASEPQSRSLLPAHRESKEALPPGQRADRE